MSIQKYFVTKTKAMCLVILLMMLVLNAVAFGAENSYVQGPVQIIKYGEVQGSVVNDGNCLLWTGIPYAKAPVGELRWKEPQDPDTWAGTFSATRPGNPNSKDLPKWDAWTEAKSGPSQLIFDADLNKAIIKMSRERTSYVTVLKEIEADNSISKEAKDKIIKNVLNGRWFSGLFDEHFGNPSLWVSDNN